MHGGGAFPCRPSATATLTVDDCIMLAKSTTHRQEAKKTSANFRKSMRAFRPFVYSTLDYLTNYRGRLDANGEESSDVLGPVLVLQGSEPDPRLVARRLEPAKVVHRVVHLQEVRPKQEQPVGAAGVEWRPAVLVLARREPRLLEHVAGEHERARRHAVADVELDRPRIREIGAERQVPVLGDGGPVHADAGVDLLDQRVRHRDPPCSCVEHAPRARQSHGRLGLVGRPADCVQHVDAPQLGALVGRRQAGPDEVAVDVRVLVRAAQRELSLAGAVARALQLEAVVEAEPGLVKLTVPQERLDESGRVGVRDGAEGQAQESVGGDVEPRGLEGLKEGLLPDRVRGRSERKDVLHSDTSHHTS